MKLKIDKRLQDIASFVDKCNIIADIGTDHGYLPVFLVLNNIADMAIASDVKEMPLNAAKDNIKYYGLENKIKTIKTNGLDNIPSVNYVIMAGMGGLLIKELLEKKKTINDYYILEPNNNEIELRKYLNENNYFIIDEKISYENDKYYEIMKVVENKKQILSNIEIIYGPINLKNKEINFINKWKKILERYQNILDNFKGNDLQKESIISKINEIKFIIGE